ncbi:MAG: sigma 54-interacting transcriptional regulator [Acidobacteriota bacterium]
MKYLMYYCDGFIKKFPLKKFSVTIGWNKKNDLPIKDDMVSNFHLKIDVEEERIIIHDLDSTNGTYFEGGKVKEAVVKLGESFSAGSVDFFLRKGDLEEFKASEELIPLFNVIGRENEAKIKNRRTRYLRNIYREVLKQILKIGLKKESINELFLEISHYLSNLTDFGSLFIISKWKDKLNIHISLKRDKTKFENIELIIEENENIFLEKIKYKCVSGNNYFYSYPFSLKGKEAVLLHIPDKGDRIDKKVDDFLFTLVKEIELISNMISEVNGSNCEKELFEKNGDIMGKSKIIKDLLKQTDKISKSDIFILLQGESGTGKELFARMIHERSKRSKKEFVAINCAAIPEQLLEAEFFGYEKGAFTGAYNQKKGKLELACGGTLILDEIGDMPFPLQARLLRALQENEFYRLGGTNPIKVNLRIISLTNKNLRELISDGKFREDLYYRLVHHVIEIPPLRERKEDILILINHFSNEFAKKLNKNLKGYSVKALKALQGYNWPGNVRQLKNEVNRIVNLTDEDELVSFDIISNDIKMFFSDDVEKVTQTEKKETEVEKILRIMGENNWNKTHAASELGMTYRGLHKKMKRMGIDKENIVK